MCIQKMTAVIWSSLLFWCVFVKNHSLGWLGYDLGLCAFLWCHQTFSMSTSLNPKCTKWCITRLFIFFIVSHCFPSFAWASVHILGQMNTVNRKCVFTLRVCAFWLRFCISIRVQLCVVRRMIHDYFCLFFLSAPGGFKSASLWARAE